MLQILAGFDLAGLGHNSPAALHLLAEAQRRAYVDRFTYLADPDFATVPFAGITAPEYAAARRATIDPRRADLQPAPGDPWAFEPGRDLAAAGARAAASGGPDATCTTHLCAVDRDRMLVSLTNTLMELWGSRVVIPGTGMLLNDGITWFDPRPGRLNSVSPHRRSHSNMAPLVVLRDGRPWLAIGAPGGRRLTTGILQALINLVDFGLPIAEAAGAPRVHSEDADTYVDSRLPAETISALERYGQRVTVQEENYSASNFGRVVGILVDDAAGLLRGGVHLWQPATAVGV
jgi:gamma-glutamyltranspeptidase/glutathione hydrolase